MSIYGRGEGGRQCAQPGEKSVGGMRENSKGALATPSPGGPEPGVPGFWCLFPDAA